MEQPVQLLQPEFGSAVTFSLLTREKDAESVLRELTRVCDGRVETMLSDTGYRAWEETVDA